MNKLITFILTFVIAFLVSMLLDWSFVQGNIVRESLTVVLILCVIAAGFSVLRAQNTKKEE